MNYSELGELRRMAQTTIENRQIVINDLAVRRAVEELRKASDFDQVRSILTAAFDSSDFDAFELQVRSLHGDPSGLGETSRRVDLEQVFPNGAISSLPSSKLAMDPVTSSNRRRGSLVVYRANNQRDLKLDVSFLTSEFPVALADSLDRVLTAQLVPVAARPGDADFWAPIS